MVRFNQVSKYYGSQDVLKNISFKIQKEEKIGLIGPNGAGKTTLIRLLNGEEETSSGSVTREKDTRIGQVPQYIRFEEQQTVGDLLLADFRYIEAELRKEEEELSAAGQQEDLQTAFKRYQKARDAFDNIGGYELPQRAERLLDSLGLGGKYDQRVSSLSGGERNILSLAQALLHRPNLLVLDEPGNHLDYLGLAWLEKFLARFPGSVLIVSHNRYLLDRIAGKIFELENCRLKEYQGNYSIYRMAKLRTLVARQADYAANQKRLAQLEALVKRFAEIARNRADPSWGKRLRARKKQLEREKKQAVQKPDLNHKSISLEIRAGDSKADIALQVNSYGKTFGQRVLFEDAGLEITCGERVALVGPNGSGKTTFLKDVVAKASWDNPYLRVGPSLTVGYCAQNQEILDPQATILEEFLSLRAGTKREVFAVLARFLFSWQDLDKSIGSLSGGEKNRLQLARLMTLEANFLILDEPTNHMDIPSREAIEEVLSSFKGTILVVSHDRYLLDKIATCIVEIRDRGFHPFYGNFSEFWAAREHQAGKMAGSISTRSKQYREGIKKGIKGEKNKKLQQENRGSQIELRISELEKQKLKVEDELGCAFSAGDHIRGRKLSDRLEKLTRQIDKLYGEWEKEME